jgi:hypothetical protein
MLAEVPYMKTTKVTDKEGGPPKRERTNTIARPSLIVYAAPRRIPHLHTTEKNFCFVYKFLRLQTAFALGTEWSGD